jgi:hypothetical protein
MDDDVLEKAFGLLKAHSHERAEYQLELEEKLMAVQHNSTRRFLSPLAIVAVVLALCVVAGGAEATMGVGSKIVSVFFDFGNGPEKAGDFPVNENGGLTVGVGVGFSGPGGEAYAEPGVSTIDLDSSEVTDGSVTLGIEVATDNDGSQQQ